MADEGRKIARFQRAMISYWQLHGRHTLPWRSTRDPWHILLAEVLLRKTTSGQAAAVYHKLVGFSPAQIAALEIDALAEILKPLGIHHVRAEQIQRIASAVVGAVAADLASESFLRSLPGIGQYIVNSVLCCAFGMPLPAMDTNMIRVMERVFSWRSLRSRAREDRALWTRAGVLVPHDKPREFNWGVLDFASAVCTYRKPKCSICPINSICDYYQTLQSASLGTVENG